MVQLKYQTPGSTTTTGNSNSKSFPMALPTPPVTNVEHVMLEDYETIYKLTRGQTISRKPAGAAAIIWGKPSVLAPFEPLRFQDDTCYRPICGDSVAKDWSDFFKILPPSTPQRPRSYATCGTSSTSHRQSAAFASHTSPASLMKIPGQDASIDQNNQKGKKQ